MLPNSIQSGLMGTQMAEHQTATNTQNLEAERALLGCLLTKPDALGELAATITVQDFASKEHAYIYAAIQDLGRSRKAVDLVTVSAHLSDKGMLQNAGGSAYIAEVAGSVVSARNWAQYAEIVAEKGRLRRILAGAEQVRKAVESGGYPDTVQRKVEELVAASREQVAGQSVQLVHFIETVAAAEELATTDGRLIGLSTGYDNVDKMFTGMKPGELIVVYGETKHRKSMFVQNVAANVAAAGHPVLFIGLEMVGEQNTERWLKMGFEDLPIVYPAQLPTYLAVDKYVEAAKEEGIELVVIDHLHMWRPDGETEAAGITNICIELKRVAMEHRVPMILVSHVSGDKTSQGPPDVKRLKGSTSIAQLADKVICVYSPGVEFACDDDKLEVWMKLSRRLPNAKVATLNILPNARLTEPTTEDVFTRTR